MPSETHHYDDVIMMAIASQITSLTIVYSAVYSGAHQRKHQSSASLAFVWEIHRGPVNSPHKWPVTRKMFPFDDVIMYIQIMNFSWRILLTYYTVRGCMMAVLYANFPNESPTEKTLWEYENLQEICLRQISGGLHILLLVLENMHQWDTMWTIK